MSPTTNRMNEQHAPIGTNTMSMPLILRDHVSSNGRLSKQT